ncbi:MAG TPA: hypothetical protein VG475_15370, partial [Pseudolabrys sp.]|nr:hypothetical protein [Pseudolabrys sp.]
MAAAAASFRQKRPRSLQDYMRTNDKGGWLIVKPTGHGRAATNNCTKLALNDLYVGILFMFICVHSITEYAPRPVFRGGARTREVGSRMTAFSAIIDELETAVQSRSDGRRVEIL